MAGPGHASLARIPGTHPWHGPCGDFSIVPPAVLAQGRLHGLEATISPRPRRTDSSRTLESAGDKDAFARPANALRGAACCVLAVPCLPSPAFLSGGRRAARASAATERSGCAPKRATEPWSTRMECARQLDNRQTCTSDRPHTGDTPSCEACRSPAPGATPSRIGENCYE